MASYAWWCSTQSVVIRWFRLPRQSGRWLQREPRDSLCDRGRERDSSHFLIIMRHHWWMRIICDTIKVMQEDGSIVKYKARFVARGSWKEGIDYEETLAPMARYTSIMALAAKLEWKLHQMDVKTTFLNGVVKDEVYLEQSLGFETHDRQSHVCRWEKSLYWLKQVLRTSYGWLTASWWT